MKMLFTALLVAGVTAFGIVARASAPTAQGGSRSVWDGVYSAAQATRGETTYVDECARCHGDGLSGTGDSGPPLAGNAFVGAWNGKSIGDLFERIRTTMPKDTPGRLTRQQIADVLAYVLKGNEFPPGQAALEPDTAALQVTIQAKVGQRP